MATGLEMYDSIWLCETLETIGISALLRRRWKSNATFKEIMGTIGSPGESSEYVFGSIIEGTTVSDLIPDLDILHCNELYPVREHLPKESTGCELLMITEPDTSAGYVKLQLVSNGLPLTIKESKFIPLDIDFILKTDLYGRLVLINSRPILDKPGVKIEKRGPAETLKPGEGSGLDNVHAYRCRSWPHVAKEWIERERRHGWPQQSIIKHFITLGCFLVGVGHHESKEEDLEWRLSFSLQERELMFGLNDVQYKCYVILKLIKKDVITATVGESITSYHCKTCLFYTIERNPLDIWKPENVFSCVKKCLQLLWNWTINSYCPNYFIPTENMFDRRIKGRLRKKLIEILEQILSEGFGVLNRIKTSNIDIYLQNRENIDVLHSLRRESATNIHDFVLSFQLTQSDRCVMKVWSILYIHIKRNIIQSPCDSIRVIKELMERFSNSVPITEHTVKDTQEVVDFVLPFLHTILASLMASYAMVCTDQTQRTNYIRESEKHFKQGMSFDLTSGRLKYLTFLYFNGKYSECERELKMLEERYKNVDIIMPGHSKTYDIVPKMFFPLDITVRDFLRTHVHASVMFLPTEYPLVHEALQFEMFRSFGTPQNSWDGELFFWYDWAVVDSKVYMYFLWYLLSTKMNKPVLDRFCVIFKLILCTYDLLYHRETAFNLISWICLQEGFIQKAITFLIASWQEVKNRDINDYLGMQGDYNHNAAKWHMLMIVKRLLDNGEIPTKDP